MGMTLLGKSFRFLILAQAVFVPLLSEAGLITFDGNGSGSVLPYQDTVNWDPEQLPGVGDDAVVVGRFNLTNGSVNNVSSLEVNGGGSFLGNGTINVVNNVTINSGLEVQANGRLTWGGQAVVGDGTGTDVLGTVYGSDNDKIVGNDLTLASNGQLRFRFFNVPAANTTEALIELAGDLNFGVGSQVRVTLEGGAANSAIAEGSYFLVESTNLTGPLPTLLLTNFTPAQSSQFFLQDFNNGLYLTSVVIVPEPSTTLLLLGLFLSFGLKRRRRAFRS